MRRVKQAADLKRALKASYGFSSLDAIDEFFTELLDLEGFNGALHLRTDIIGTGTPTNLHRKLYAAAMILDDAKKRGVPVSIKPAYLTVGKNVYIVDLNYIRRKGFSESILEEALTKTLGVYRGTARLYISGKKPMPKTQHLKLRAFIENDLPYMSVFDLSGARRKEELQRIRQYSGGWVLIKTERGLSEEDIKSLQEVREIAYRRGCPFLFLYPFPRKLPQELNGYMHPKGLFQKPDYVAIQKAFKPPR